ncbi:MAG TPA: NUDIX hydrolase [Conexibacter sp.]|jgi:8-oxo-dGTP pyrophosphatase MutT (NUDIX family)|nr:NUDIX hydrolase [Conexibacter sp.]
MSAFEQIGSETVWSGHIGTVRVERYRHADGEEVVRENVAHPGAVAIVAHDDEHVWLVRQPREICGEQALLEIPAGKLDVEGEDPRAAAERELAEEIGKAAQRWEHLKTIYTSPGFTDERIDVYLATDLRDVPRPAVDEDERIEIVAWPLHRLDDAIAECSDAKSLVGLLLLRLRTDRA